jgi:hypothetical protein
MGLHNPLAKQPASYVKKKEYTFNKTLAEGTFGIVRSATWNTANPPINVAIKVISKKILKGHDEIVQGEMDVLKVRLRRVVLIVQLPLEMLIALHSHRRRVLISHMSSSFSIGSSPKIR